jgi:hypothetical protein
MPRTLDANTETLIARRSTEPGWLIQIDAATGTLRYCTRGTLSYGGYTWTGGAVLSGVEVSHDIGAAVDLELPNTDNSASSLALSNALRDADVTIYALYEDSGTSSAYATLLRALKVDGVDSISSTRVKFTLATISGAASRVPDIVIGPPLCNHIPPAGTTIRWGAVTVTLERK